VGFNRIFNRISNIACFVLGFLPYFDPSNETETGTYPGFHKTKRRASGLNSAKMNKSVKLGNVVNMVLTLIAGTYLVWALAFALGIVNISPFFANGAVLGAGALLATAKGAEKVKKYRIAHQMHEANTKGGKKAFALSIPREQANVVKNEINALLAFCGGSLFSWPSQNPDKEKYITFGFWPSYLFVVQNYLETGALDMTEARKHGEALRAEKEQYKADKKATKETKGSPLAAKIQALRDMRDAGEITPDQYNEKALALIG